jgi:probable HAF family extracellular repeat protein
MLHGNPLRQTTCRRRAPRRSPARWRRELFPGLESLEGRSLLSYTITDLGTLGGPSSEAIGLNNNGQVVGEWQTGRTAADGVPITHGFIWDSAHGMRDLGALGGDQSSVAVAINDAGRVAGTSSTAPVKVRLPGGMRDVSYVVTDHAVTWGSTLKAQGLGDGSAYGINGAGEVVGTSGGHATLWSGGVATNLGTLGGIAPSTVPARALGINTAGHVVGAAPVNDSYQDDRAFLWTSTTPDGTQGAMTNLGALALSPGSVSGGSALNALDEVVGSSDVLLPTSVLLETAILETGGRMYNLGTLGGNYVESEASGINASGVVVGDSNTGYGQTLAWIWSPTSPNGTSGHMTDLNALIPAGSGWVLNVAKAVDDAGQIAGWGTINGMEHAFLLSPTTSALAQPMIGTPGRNSINTANPLPRDLVSLQGLVAPAPVGVASLDSTWWTPSAQAMDTGPPLGATSQVLDLTWADLAGHPHRKR